MLKFTDVELELLPDKDVYLFLENPNGGISMMLKRTTNMFLVTIQASQQVT